MLDTEQKIFIHNRAQERLCLVVRKHEAPRGVAVVLHGLGATKDQKMIVAAAQVYFEQGFTTLRFDTTNTFGESDGDIERATLTKHYEDLEDVLAWLLEQPWYSQPLTLVGHSMGGYAVARYAEIYPERVASILPISPVVSGELTLQAHIAHDPAFIETWRETGWREDSSVSTPGRVRRIPWSHMEDRLQHSLLPDAHKLTMPVTIIVGAEDTVTLTTHMQLLFDAIPGPHKQLTVIPGCGHVFRSDEHCAQLCAAITAALAATR